MKKIITICFSALVALPSVASGGYTVEMGKVTVGSGDVRTEIQWYTPSVVRVVRYPASDSPQKHSLAVIKSPEKVKIKVDGINDGLSIRSGRLKVEYDTVAECISIYDVADGRQLISEKASSSVFSPIDDSGKKSYRVSQTFILDDNEPIFGLGQHRHGLWNQRGSEQHLEQVNMEIAIPMVQSPKGYALYWDNYSATDFSDGAQGMKFDSQAGDVIDYYFIYGGNADDVIAQWRDMSGQAPMYPLWTFGFNQSRERYRSQDELVGVVKRYRELGVPLDGIVQDWQYWGEDNKQWNAVEFLNPSFPNPKRMMDDVHALNAHATISIWPSFGPNTSIYKDFDSAGMLMGLSTFPQDGNTRVYNVYNKNAREIYWKYIKENMVDIGMDGWWLDATEPEHSPIYPEDYDYQTGMGSFRSMRNAFPLLTVGGVYDNHRRDYKDKRVFILTRSAFAGQQRYGAQSWSGDIEASWKTLRNQIPAALNFTLCGIPYWNSDIGGFYTWRDYPDALNDPAYHELYTRWMQFAAFTGMMRSHGTNCPREIFNFGVSGDSVYDAQVKAINLRYRMLPYIYSAAWDVTSGGASLMRPLYADYVSDGRSVDVSDQFLFGRSILVAPMVESGRSRSVYLPSGNRWIDFWSGAISEGGKEISANAPLDIIPLYVKAGSIIPIGPQVQYAAEKPWDDLQIRVYPGTDCEFTLYEDEGDNYNYEKGRYSTIRMTWDDTKRELTIGGRDGQFDGMPESRRFRIAIVGDGSGLGLDNESSTKSVEYDGKRKTIRF